VLVLVGQPVRQGPRANLVVGAVGSAVTGLVLTIALLEEALILALQLVVQDDASHVAATAPDPFSGSFVGSVKVRVVGDLWAPGEAGIEALTVIERAVLGGFKEIAAARGERHERGPGTPGAEGPGLDEPRTSQVLNVLVAARALAGIAGLQVPLRHGAKGADCRQQSNLGAAQIVRTLPQRDGLSAAAARQRQTSREDLVGIARQLLTGVSAPAAPATGIEPVVRVGSRSFFQG
jgi:hypothetical protein